MFLAGCLFVAALWALSRTDWLTFNRESLFPAFDAWRDEHEEDWGEWDDEPECVVLAFPARDRGQVPA